MPGGGSRIVRFQGLQYHLCRVSNVVFIAREISSMLRYIRTAKLETSI